MRAIFIRRAPSNRPIMNEVIGVVEGGASEGIMSQDTQTREARFKLRLQSIVTVIGAVAEEVNSLSPTETVEKRFTFISIRLIEVADRLVHVKGRTITGKYMGSFVANVADFNRSIPFELMLNRN